MITYSRYIYQDTLTLEVLCLHFSLYTGWLKSFESDTYNQIEESKFIRYFNISSSI